MRLLLYFLVTVVVGFFAIAFIGGPLNWPDAGAVFAVATMGCFIIREIRALKPPENGARDGE